MRTLWRHCQIATMVDGQYNLITGAAMLTDGPQIVWLGKEECSRKDRWIMTWICMDIWLRRG